MDLLTQLKQAQKEAMLGKEKLRLTTIRMIMAAIKQKEIDERVTVGDEDIVTIMTKMVKQRKDAQQQYEQAERPELAEKEGLEIAIIEAFLPAPLTEQELEVAVTNAIQSCGATGMQDMGKVMAQLKAPLAGKADMSQVSAIVKRQLS